MQNVFPQIKVWPSVLETIAKQTYKRKKKSPWAEIRKNVALLSFISGLTLILKKGWLQSDISMMLLMTIVTDDREEE